MVARPEILNFSRMEKEFDTTFRDRKVRLEIPSLHVEKTTVANSLDSIRKDIFEMAKQFPHRRLALTYKTSDEELLLEIHPITGAA